MYAMHICGLYSQRVYCIQSISNWYCNGYIKISHSPHRHNQNYSSIFLSLHKFNFSAHCVHIDSMHIYCICMWRWLFVCVFSNLLEILGKFEKERIYLWWSIRSLDCHYILIYLLMCKSTLCLSSLPPCMHFYAFHSNKLTCEIICKRVKKITTNKKCRWLKQASASIFFATANLECTTVQMVYYLWQRF